jgi:RNA polymerase sigma factor (sigma-70 family)
MEDWALELANGRPEPAWDLFVGRYRRVIFAAIRHYARDYDDVMDVFARVCEALREDDLRRLRSFLEQPLHRARFSTWLVAVVRNLTVDWFRHRDGRRRITALAVALPPLQRRIFELVFFEQRRHLEAYELIRTRDAPDLSYRAFLAELRSTYLAVAERQRGRVLHDLAGAPPPEVEVEAAAEPAPGETSELLERALGALSPEDRTAVHLYVTEELSAAEVARILGWSPKTVYNRVYRALAALREHLEGAGLRREDL